MFYDSQGLLEPPLGGLERPSGGLERPSGGPMILSGLYGFRRDSLTLRKDPKDSKESLESSEWQFLKVKVYKKVRNSWKP